MPLTRYQIRNEYSLADPELYRAADRDDPEALLEGVAMAGLVGVLRQLGDLAEFAAEIFHDLHEEVMTTAARGHGLIIRVQQLEAEFPPMEKAFLSQTSHSLFLYNRGTDWHPNPRMDQNMITRGDLPRFVMDSYEECRGPPRLFLLDKFDIAGAGACLMRYSDPSFFKATLSSNETVKAEVQREKKARKIKKKGTRWWNGETPEDFPTSHVKLHQLFSEERFQVENNVPVNCVKLKKRQLNVSAFGSTDGKSYMERFVEIQSPECKVVCENSVSPRLKMKSSDTIVLDSGSEINEISTWSPANKLLQNNKSPVSSPSKQETVLEPCTDELAKDVIEGGILEKLPEPMPDIGIEKIPSAIYEVDDQKESMTDGESKTEASADGYPSDDIASEIDHYMDALTTMESELETETESRHKNEHGFFKVERRDIDTNRNEEQKELQAQFSDSTSTANSSASGNGNNSLEKGRSSFSYSDMPNNLAENVPSNGDGEAKVYPFTETCAVEIVNLSSEKLTINQEVIRSESSEFVVPSSSCNEEGDIPSHRSEFRKASCISCVTDSSTTLSHLSPGRTVSEVQLVEPEPFEIASGCMKTDALGPTSNTGEDGKNLCGDLACTTNVSGFSSEIRGDSLPTGSSSLPVEELDDMVTESAALLHLSDVSDPAVEGKDDDNALARVLELDEWFAESDALLHLPDISDLAVERNDDDNAPARVLPTKYAGDSPTENLTNGKLESPHSVALHAEQLCGFAEDQEICAGITSVPEYLPFSNTPGDLDDVKRDGIVAELDNFTPSTRDNSEYLTSIVDISETGEFAEQDLPEMRYKVLPLTLDLEEVGPVCSGAKALSNSSEVLSNIFNSDANDGPTSNVVHLSSFDSVEKGATSLDLSSGCIASDSAKPVSETELHLQSEDLVSGTVHEEAVEDGTNMGPNLIGSPSRNHIKLQEESLPSHGKSDDLDQYKKEFSEASSPKYLPGSDAQREVNPLAHSPTYLNSVSCNPDSHHPSSSELLDSHDSLMVECFTSLNESNEELESKSPQQNHSESLEDGASSSAHALPEPQVPLQQALELQGDKLNVELLQESGVSLELSSPHSEQKVSPKHIDQDGCFYTPSKSSPVDPLNQLSGPFSSLLANHNSESSEIALDPLDSIFHSFGPEATSEQPLEPKLSRPVLDFPLPVPNAVQTNLDAMPPLPPLPPLQWRLGKLRHGSLISEGDMMQPSLNPFSPLLPETADVKAQQGFPTIPQPLNPFLPVSGTEERKAEHGFEMLGGEMVQPSLNPFLSCDENNQQGFLTSEGAIMQPLNPFLPLPTIETEKSEHGSPSLGGEMVQPSFNTSASLLHIEDAPRHASPFLQGELVEPVNVLAPKPNIEDETPHNTSLTSCGETVQPLNSSASPLSAEDAKAQDGLTSVEETSFPLNTNELLPTVEDGKPNGNPQMRHLRPRDPLIEAVASHDKRTLRKVMERVQPLNGPKVDERDSLLEQIRAKSFNLKPAVVARPSIQGPKTNLKVAAILEKANAIRQALAGSDEDDDGDSWSDS